MCGSVYSDTHCASGFPGNRRPGASCDALQRQAARSQQRGSRGERRLEQLGERARDEPAECPLCGWRTDILMPFRGSQTADSPARQRRNLNFYPAHARPKPTVRPSPFGCLFAAPRPLHGVRPGKSSSLGNPVNAQRLLSKTWSGDHFSADLSMGDRSATKRFLSDHHFPLTGIDVRQFAMRASRSPGSSSLPASYSRGRSLCLTRSSRRTQLSTLTRHALAPK